MNVRKLSGRLSSWLLAPAIVVAMTTVDARAHALRAVQPRDGSTSVERIELARCPNARPAASPPGRASRGGGSGARKKPAIWNIKGRGEVPQRPNTEENSRRGGFYDEDGKYHADEPGGTPIPKP